jgi:C4-dicarboxylate transporter, DctM subunit
LAIVAIGTMWWAARTDLLYIFIQRVYSGTTSFPLLAIPFFIVAGNLMNTGGMTTRIFAAAQVFVGRIRGGLGHVNVVASMIFAGMSATAVSDAAGLGTIEIKAMRERGYPMRFACGITGAAAIISPVIPPSIAMVVYGWLSGTSIAALFIAGIVPGLAIGLR